MSAGMIEEQQSCMVLGDDDIGDRPIRIFQGSYDDWTPAVFMQRYVDRLRAAGRGNISLVIYEGAHHSFDNSKGPTSPRRLPEAANLTRCLWEEQPDGRLVDSDTGRPAAADLPCVSRGVSIGQNAWAHAKAIKDVKTFLYEAFQIR